MATRYISSGDTDASRTRFSVKPQFNWSWFVLGWETENTACVAVTLINRGQADVVL